VTWATCHKGKPTDPIQTDTASNLNLAKSSIKCCGQYKATNSRRDNLKTSFSEHIAELEKEFLPKKKVKPQTDKLKAYHESLL